MGVLSAFSGNAGEIPPEEANAALKTLLIPDEVVQKAFHVGRDMFAFTDLRLILVDKQGFTGAKVEYRTIPYRSITNFSIETSGVFDLDAELKIWVSGNPIAIQKEFNRKVNIYDVQAALAQMMLR